MPDIIISGPVGIRTRVRSSGGPYAIQAILQALDEKERVCLPGVRYSPGDPVPPVEREEANEDCSFSILLGELGVSAASA